MPMYLEATVILPVDGPRDEATRSATYASMREELKRWSIDQMWWGERNIEGPAALLSIDSSTDMLAQLFTITDMGYVITRVHLKHRRA